MKAQLAAVAAEIEEIGRRAERLVAQAGPERLLRRPSAESWSAAECLEHLNISARAFLPEWKRLCDEARRNGVADTGKPFKTDFMGKVLIWMLEPPPRMRFPTPPNFVPVPIQDPASVLPDFLDCQQQILSAISESEGLALDRIRLASPFNRKVKYSVWSSFRLTGAHERRHIWQAERAIAAANQSESSL